MTEGIWRPLGVDSAEDIAEYDALHDGIPAWMRDAYWEWVRGAIDSPVRNMYGERASELNVGLVESMCQTLKIRIPRLDNDFSGPYQLRRAIEYLQSHGKPLQIADYLLAYSPRAQSTATQLSAILDRSKSAWEIGRRSGRPGLVRRVPKGVQLAADEVMRSSDQAGVRLAKAWEDLFGIDPRPSDAYRKAIQAVEDAAIPVVSPTNSRATLGTVLKQMEDQGDWNLPMGREHPSAGTGDTLISMMRVLWFGQHDRHGGQPTAPGEVTFEEARVAVLLATVLVDWFASGLIVKR